jgi:hypothetical protein
VTAGLDDFESIDERKGGVRQGKRDAGEHTEPREVGDEQLEMVGERYGPGGVYNLRGFGYNLQDQSVSSKKSGVLEEESLPRNMRRP